MNNQEMKFDSMTGQPLNKENINQNTNINYDQTVEQKSLQSIPTIEQKKEQFIDNSQNTILKQEESKTGEKVNYTFIIILFIIIFITIFFLFPIIFKNI